jgi:hypothetical protein
MARLCLSVSVLLCIIPLAFAQHPPESDPQALSLVTQSLAALTNGVPVNDVVLTGSANWIAGSDQETGLATLQAKGTGESRIDLNLSGGTRAEIRNDSPGSPQGETVAPDGSLQRWAEHNCWINASWFFPTLSILAATSDSSVVLSYVGVENRGATSVHHIRAYRNLSDKSTPFTELVQRLSSEDIYLDSASLLPVAFGFTAHPDDDEDANILVEIDFSSFQPMNGILVPTHVQKLINGGLALDVTVFGAAVNSGMTDLPFTIQ